MNRANIDKGFKKLGEYFSKPRETRILEDSAIRVLEEALSRFDKSIIAFEQAKRAKWPEDQLPKWGYEIGPQSPLQFKPSNG